MSFNGYTSGEPVTPCLLANGAHGISDIEGKIATVAASERGQRTSFNEERRAKAVWRHR